MYTKFIVGVVYCLIGAEVFLRLFAPQPMIPRHVCATYYGIRGNAPNKTYWHIGEEYKVKLHTNSKGIRSDREKPYEKPQAIKRIVLLGDSFGMGYEVDYKDMFSTRLEYYLKDQYGIHAEVVNLSTSGHGNAEELLVLQNEGLKYHPDLVLLAWHTTDYDDNVRSALYGLNDNLLYRKNETYLPAVEIREKLDKIPGYAFLEQYSNLYSFFREIAGSKTKEWLTNIKRKQQINIKSNDTEKRADIYAKELTLLLLKEIKKTSEENHAQFLLLDIPVRKDREVFYSNFPLPIDQAKLIFNIYSPIDGFLQYKGEKIYWEKGHGHFTPLGCDIVGKGLAQYIIENQLLK